MTSVNFSVISVFHLQHNILWSQGPIEEDITSMQKSVSWRQYNIHVHPRNLQTNSMSCSSFFFISHLVKSIGWYHTNYITKCILLYRINVAQIKIKQERWNTCNYFFTLSLTCCQTCQGRQLRMTPASTRSTCSDYRTRPRWSGMGRHCLWSRMPCENSSIKNIKCNCYPETKSTWKILVKVHFTVKCWITEKKISPSIQSFQKYFESSKWRRRRMQNQIKSTDNHRLL